MSTVEQCSWWPQEDGPHLAWAQLKRPVYQLITVAVAPEGGASILLPAGQADRLGLVDWFDCTPAPSVPMLQLGGATSLRRVHLKTFHCSSTLVG